ncbi:MAG: thiamine pyrophosphate-dependent enzyme [Clostridiales bacterium]|nr:thiamine pyrophosphate-dependent enzyme [Clostridiales bacterium]
MSTIQEKENFAEQEILYDSGNELAAYAAKQINYHVMGYYPITPSTQIAENLDLMKAEGKHDIAMIAAEGEHSAAGICYGASAGGARVINATSANGLLYALEQFPVQSGTRVPMVMNVACRTISGPLCIKGDHSDIMYLLNAGWIILFADEPQMVYDFNLLGLKLAEAVNLPVAVAFDGFFTSHQKRKCFVFSDDAVVQRYLGPKLCSDNPNHSSFAQVHSVLDLAHPISVGSYMNEPDVINNRYQLHLAMEEAREKLPVLFEEYEALSGRRLTSCIGYCHEDADILLFILGSSYYTAMEAVDLLRGEGIKAGVVTLHVLRPFPTKELQALCKNARIIVAADRQDSYGAGGGNMSLELRAALLNCASDVDDPNQAAASLRAPRIITRIYGLGGKDFFVEDAVFLLREGLSDCPKEFDYYGITKGSGDTPQPQYFKPLTDGDTKKGLICCTYDETAKKMTVTGGALKDMTAMPMRIAPGHGACPGCGIPVNVNLLLKGIEGNVVLLFQTGCGMVVTTGYPKTAFRIPYLHNLFQNGAATLSGLVEAFHQRQKRGEYPDGEITFLMVSGDGGMDIGMGSALGTALRNHRLILFEYDNGGYMNTGYQLSYSTPMGAKSSTSHVGKTQYGKTFFHKDTPEIMSATHIPYIATVAESNPTDFIKKAAKAAAYSREFGTAYIKTLSACPLNWNDNPSTERSVIAAAVDCCYFPLYEIEQGITSLSYDPEAKNKKIPITDWFAMMGRTKHLAKKEYSQITDEIQREVDRRYARLRARAEHPLL